MDAAGIPIAPGERLRLLGDRICALLQLGDPEGWVLAAQIPDDAASPAETMRLADGNAQSALAVTDMPVAVVMR